MFQSPSPFGDSMAINLDRRMLSRDERETQANSERTLFIRREKKNPDEKNSQCYLDSLPISLFLLPSFIT